MRQVLTFLLDRECYGLDISQVREIVEAPRRFFIPNAPPCYLGAINFHGAILPVLDLNALLGLAPTASDERFIVLDAVHGGLALAVSRLLGIVRLSGAATLPGDPERQRQACIGELLQDRDALINLLDLPQLLSRLEAACEKDTGGSS